MFARVARLNDGDDAGQPSLWPRPTTGGQRAAWSREAARAELLRELAERPPAVIVIEKWDRLPWVTGDAGNDQIWGGGRWEHDDPITVSVCHAAWTKGEPSIFSSRSR